MRQILRRMPWLLVSLVLVGLVARPVLATPSVEPNWTSPGATTLKEVGPANSTQSSPYVFPSLDCDQITYRPVGLFTAMQQGCFTQTAYGLMSSDQQSIIFNQTDEALPLLPYSAHELLVPWTESAAVLALDNVTTGGQTLSLYKNLLADLQDKRDIAGQLIAKQVTAPPDLTLRDATGNTLIINPQTISFSPGASWLVAEALNGSFVRINLATLDIVSFAPAFNSLGSSGLSQSEVGVSDDGRYIAIANRQFTSFKVYDLSGCNGPVCPFHDYWPFITSKYSGLQAVGHVRFINNNLLVFNAAGGAGSQATTYELSPTDHIGSLLDYLALGDSYTSGEGAFDYLLGTDTAENSCHLSRHSYPLLLINDLFGSNAGHSVACSGAVINDIVNTSYNYVGQMAGGQSYNQLQQSVPAFLINVQASFLPGYVAQQRFVSQYQPATITVSVGGDDAGFGDILERCVEPHLSRHESDQTCFNTYEDRQEIIHQIDKTKPRLVSLYKQLRASSPGSHIYAIGYPQIVVDNGDCAINVHLNKSELEFAIELVNYLNNNMQQAASSAGVQYVDISQALVGHRLCEARNYDIAINGLTAGKDGGILGLKVFGKESYHPTALGQQLMEQAILRQTNNLHKWSPDNNPPINDGKKLSNAPKSGRQINNRISKKLTTHTLTKGKSTSILINGMEAGLPANHVFLVYLDGTNGSFIGSATSDNSGVIEAMVNIPDTIESGSHTIDLIGPGLGGESTDVSQPVYVVNSPDDADGDGLPDNLDSCPTAINSGQDEDQDGIDDTCDGYIGKTQSSDTSSATASPSLSSTLSVQTASSLTTQKLSTAKDNIVAAHAKRSETSTLNGVLAARSIALKRQAKKHRLPGIDPIVITLLLLILLACLIYKIVCRRAGDE